MSEAGSGPSRDAGHDAAGDSPDFHVHADIEVRFRDTDAMGHVNNAVYVTYLEVARQEYWKLFNESGHDYRHVPFVVAHVSISFRSPALVGETVRVHLRTSWVSRSSFGMVYKMRERDSGRLLVEAESTQVTFDYDTNRSMPVPDALRASLERVERHSLPGRPD